MGDPKGQIMKMIKCGFCQEEKPKKTSKMLRSSGSIKGSMYYCETCMENPIAQRRLRVRMKKELGDYYKY